MSRIRFISGLLIMALVLPCLGEELSRTEYVRDWLLLGRLPFDDYERNFLMEAGGESGADPYDGERIHLPSGKEMQWVSYASPSDVIDLVAVYGESDRTAAYAFCHYESPVEGIGRIHLGSDDGAVVFFNGEEVYKFPYVRTFYLDEVEIGVRLKKGTNRCLIKVGQATGSWKFSMRISPQVSGLIEGVVKGRDGSVVSRSLVHLYRSGQKVDTVRTDEEGQYSFLISEFNMPYQVQVIQGDESDWSSEREIKPGDRLSVDLNLSAACILSGMVRQLDEQTANAGVLVRVSRESAQGELEVLDSQISGRDGRYRFVGLQPGEYWVSCLRNDVHPSPSGEPRKVNLARHQTVASVDFTFAPSQKGIWSHKTTLDGLSHNALNTIRGLEGGQLWVGTGEGGVCSYNGTTFKSFGSKEGFPAYRVTAVWPVNEDDVWIGTDMGLIHWDGDVFKTHSVSNGLPSNSVLSLASHGNGAIWVGTDNGVIAIQDGGLVPLKFADQFHGHSIFTLREGGDGSMWLGTEAGAMHWTETGVEVWGRDQGLPHHRVRSILPASDGSLWFATEAGLGRYENRKMSVFTENEGLLSGWVQALEEGPDGKIWIGTRKGLCHYRKGEVAGYLYPNSPEVGEVLSLWQSASGVLWIGTPKGLWQYDSQSLISYDSRDGFVKPAGTTAGTFTLGLDEKGDLIVGTEWGGLLGFSEEGGFRQLLESSRRYVRGIWTDEKGTAWLGTDHAIYRMGEGKAEKLLGASWVLALHGDQEGNLWYGNGWQSPGVKILNPDTLEIIKPPEGQGLSSDSVWSLEMLPDGTQLVGTARGVAAVRDGRTWNYLEEQGYRTEAAVWNIFSDSKGGVWCATSRGGLKVAPDGVTQYSKAGIIFHGKGQKPRIISADLRLPGDQVKSIYPGKDGIVWFGLDGQGLIGFDGTGYTQIDSRDGLAGDSVYSIQEDSRGYLWVGTLDGGVSRYIPSRQVPDIAITLVSVGDRLLTPATGAPLKAMVGDHVRFYFQETDFRTLDSKRKFQVRLANDQQESPVSEWINEKRWDWKPERTGQYVFEVRTMDRDFNYSDWVQVGWMVQKAWYQSAWLWFGGSVVLMGLVLGYFYQARGYRKHRRYSSLLQKKMLDQELKKNGELTDSYRQLKEAKIAAEQANRSKSIFLANMSHEIRTPMNAILGYAQLLQRADDIPSRWSKPIEAILHGGDHLIRLIDGILDLSKIEVGRLEMVRTDFDLREMVQGISAMFQLRCEQKGLKWIQQLEVPEVVVVNGDEGKLRQVLINLLGNAVKFTDRGWVRLRITQVEADQYVFEVKDTGRGVGDSERSRIFEAFQQGDAGHELGGTGLGLSISWKQVELMGGELDYESEPGSGSRFFFSIPMPPSQGGAKSSGKTVSNIKCLKGAEGIKILIVDDMEANRDVLSQILEKMKIQVRVAVNGLEAVEWVKRENFDMVFMDIRMPGLDGREAWSRIQQGKAVIPKAVAVTASTLAHEKCQLLEMGFEWVLSKPFHLDEIYRVIARVLGLEFELNQEGSQIEMMPYEEGRDPQSSLGAGELDPKYRNDLKEAAEIGDISTLRDLLTQLKELPGGFDIEQRFQKALDHYDTAEMLEWLESAENSISETHK